MAQDIITTEMETATPTATRRHGAALTPSLPRALRQVLASGLTTVLVDPEKGGGVILRERLDWEPQASAEVIELAEIARQALTEHLAPIEPELLGPAVAKLLAHRWRYQRMEPISDLMQEALLVDWIEDLGDFPDWAFHAAAREWRRTREDCPTIAGILALCEAEVADDRRTLRLIGRLLEAEPRAETEAQHHNRLAQEANVQG